jgi:ABC-2 type transport system ATP-binding protein/nitrous oxidase accessory protein
MIHFDRLTKRFGDYTAVDNLSLEVTPNHAVALWGPNGAGKTTVIKCLLGLLRYEGAISIGGFDAQRQGKQARALLGYVPQELAFYDDMGAAETAYFFARVKRARPERVPLVLEQVGLAQHGRKPVRALSGGMKQRLALALALLADPPVLVLDEPTSSLDTGARQQFVQLLTHVRETGRTVIFTSHRIEEVEALADEVIVMDRGVVQQRCGPSELAGVLGLRTQVKLRLDALRMDDALAVLLAQGYQVQRNGVGLLVNVPAREKAAPIHALTGAGITVSDFEME